MRWSAIPMLCAALLWTREEASAQGPTDAGHVTRGGAVLIGSSSFNQAFGHIIARALERLGYDVTRKGVSGAGLARPDYHDMGQVLERLPVEAAAVIVYLGVNDAQSIWLYPEERGPAGAVTLPFGTPRWETAYRERTRRFLERICQRGATRAVVILPVDVNRAALQRRLQRIREIQRGAAADTSCGVAVDTSGDAGHFEIDGVPRRMRDGYHMTARGAEIVWERIRPEIARQLQQPPSP